MKCPVDNTDLVLSERQGVEIDYCPNCRGVWLDRGELDKIIERSPGASSYRNEPPQKNGHEYYGSDMHGRDGHNPGQHHSSKKKERGGFLGDLFDF